MSPTAAYLGWNEWVIIVSPLPRESHQVYHRLYPKKNPTHVDLSGSVSVDSDDFTEPRCSQGKVLFISCYKAQPLNTVNVLLFVFTNICSGGINHQESAECVQLTGVSYPHAFPVPSSRKQYFDICLNWFRSGSKICSDEPWINCLLFKRLEMSEDWCLSLTLTTENCLHWTIKTPLINKVLFSPSSISYALSNHDNEWNN